MHLQWRLLPAPFSDASEGFDEFVDGGDSDDYNDETMTTIMILTNISASVF